MKRYLTLAVLVLLAVSCGGRRGNGTDEGQEDSLAVQEPPKAATLADTLANLNYKGPLPEEPVYDIVTSMGTIRVKLYKDTPKHKRNFIRLAATHYYDGVQFHRVIDGFAIQGGDPFTRDTSRIDEWGEGGPGYDIDAEIVPEHTHKRGALAAARRGNLANPMKESSGSQFYIVQNAAACAHLDGEYTVFGETIAGLGVIDRIARVQTDRNDRPVRPVFIRNIRPNDEMNRRALAEEQRAREAAEEAAEEPAEESVKKPGPEKEKEEAAPLDIVVADSTTLKQWEGRPLKKRK